MIIKHPTFADQEGMLTLWQEAFGDSREFIKMFFSTGFSFDRSMLCTQNDQVAAALYWFDCLWNGKKVAYLYAIATKKEHRGKGICKKLMAATHDELLSKNYHGAILAPADEGLSQMYGKMGYIPCAAQGMQNAECKMQNVPISVVEYRKLQKELLPPNAVSHTDAAFAYLETFAKFYKTETGILCKTEDTVQEILPYTPKGENKAMYLPLTVDKTPPAYFGLPLA